MCRDGLPEQRTLHYNPQQIGAPLSACDERVYLVPELEALSDDDTLPLPPDEMPDAAILPRPRLNRRRLVRDILEALILFAIIYTLANLLTARFVVEGPSMLPTFTTGQYVIISRLSYLLGNPQRGQVVVFTSPEDASRDLIKRVIGLPGETISIQNGAVSINGQPLTEPYINQPSYYQVEQTLGPDEYFLLGDNRNNSRDSHDFGPVTRAHLIGEAWLVYWPPEAWGLVNQASYAEPIPESPSTSSAADAGIPAL